MLIGTVNRMNYIQRTLIELRCKLFKEIRKFKKLFSSLKKNTNSINYQELYEKCMWITRVKEIERCIQNLENIGR